MGHASTAPSLSIAEAATAFVTEDARFAAVRGEAPRLTRVVETDAHEGPVYVADEDALYFTTLPATRSVPAPGPPLAKVKRIALDGERFPLEPDRVSTVREDANVANGMTLDLEGRLVACEQGTRSQHAAVTRFDLDSCRIATLADGWRGLPLNSPNDVIIKGDGTLWFTDPSYGHLQGFRPPPALGDYVYRLDPANGGLSVVADSFDKPNGLAFSPDESILYVGDSGANQEPGSYYPSRPHHIRAFDVVEGRRLEKERLFCVTNPGFPDGIKVDAAGRVYASSFSGVQVFDPEGALLGEIRLPGAVNFTFGGPDRNVLFITADDAVWAAVLNATAPTRLRGA
ncbi:MAG TPA: SMP-30/gluconolactonase/LRE family protein [Solirubrobacterales bacterium]|nr:SMP-30/gluconolactonase/LRE family protein [Solirubrobacterales bacterium]